MPEALRFGPYVTLGILGVGGMGTVYRARHPELGFEVAIKALSGEGARSEGDRRRFERELRALRALRHPGLIEVLDFGEQDGTPWFAMRRIEGGSLEDRM
ncbi:MAG: protein kinase [Planctomycetes bacterium]|nr:protein kinase [Planctomycetota bacterium]